MVNPIPSPVNQRLEQQLDDCISRLESIIGSDVLVFVGDMTGGVDDIIRYAVEQKRQASPRRKTKLEKLTVIITTLGGYIEVAQRIVDTLRYHYRVVDFIVPNYAYSAGTVLVMSGDAIFMDYYSRLGPIDPQVETMEGRQVPALGYLKQWERLLKRAEDGVITLPEVQLMIQRFDQAELYKYEQARELSCSLLEQWLATYKFKNWKVSKTRGLKVDQRMRRRRAREISEALSDPDQWHIHGYGISKDVLTRRLNLIIDDIDSDPILAQQLKDYQNLLDDYMTKMRQQTIIQIKGMYHPFSYRERTDA
jgi:hypothetical protein